LRLLIYWRDGRGAFLLQVSQHIGEYLDHCRLWEKYSYVSFVVFKTKFRFSFSFCDYPFSHLWCWHIFLWHTHICCILLFVYLRLFKISVLIFSLFSSLLLYYLYQSLSLNGLLTIKYLPPSFSLSLSVFIPVFLSFLSWSLFFSLFTLTTRQLYENQ